MRVTGNPGAVVRLTVNAGAKLDVFVNLDAGGFGLVSEPVVLNKGDGFALEEFGVPVSNWSHY